MGGIWHVWKRREKRARFWWEGTNQRDHSEDGGKDGRMGSGWILARLAGRVWSGFRWLNIVTGGSCWEHGNEPGPGATGLVKCKSISARHGYLGLNFHEKDIKKWWE